MGVGAIGGSSAQIGGMNGMIGMGIKSLNAANKAQEDMAEKLLPMNPAESGGRAASEAKGLFVDVYA